MYNLYFDDSNTPNFPWCVEILIPGISGRMSYKTKEEAEASLVPYLWRLFHDYIRILSEDDLACIADCVRLSTPPSYQVRYLLKVFRQCEEGCYV